MIALHCAEKQKGRLRGRLFCYGREEELIRIQVMHRFLNLHFTQIPYHKMQTPY